MSPYTGAEVDVLQMEATARDVNDTFYYSLENFPFHEFVKVNGTTGILSVKNIDMLKLLCSYSLKQTPETEATKTNIKKKFDSKARDQ